MSRAPAVAATPYLRLHFRRTLAALIGVNVALVWILPVLPCQDLPQHLSYARILADYRRADLPFAEYYTLPAHAQSYFLSHYLLAALTSVSSILTAARLVMTLYVVSVPLGFHALVRVIHGHDDATPPWTSLLGVLLVWTPVALLGFLPFMLAVPVFLIACALLLRLSRGPAGWRHGAGLVVACALLCSLHVIAGACLLLFALLHVIVSSEPRARRGGVLAAMGTAATFAVWSYLGESGIGAAKQVALWESLRRADGLEFVNDVYRIIWYTPPQILNEILWTVLGPFRFPSLAILGIVCFAVARFIWRARPPSGLEVPVGISLRRTVFAFAAVTCLTPFAVYVPTEVVFLNVRMFPLAFALMLALIPPRLFFPQRSTVVLVATLSCFLAHFTYRAFGFAAEAAPALRLLDLARPTAMLMSLPFHHRSAGFAKQFKITHFLPMYYTALGGGLNTQFWARYTEHLPVDYRPGKRPINTDDWFPEHFGTGELAASTYLLVEAATEEDPAEVRGAYRRAVREFTPLTEPMGCDGSWCLYRIRKDTR